MLFDVIFNNLLVISQQQNTKSLASFYDCSDCCESYLVGRDKFSHDEPDLSKTQHSHNQVFPCEWLETIIFNRYITQNSQSPYDISQTISKDKDGLNFKMSQKFNCKAFPDLKSYYCNV